MGTFPDGLAIEDLELVSVVLSDGDSVKFQFSRLSLPINSPKKWRIRKYNALYLSLEFSSIYKLTMNGWRSGAICSPIIEQANGKIGITIIANDLKIIVESKFFRIADLSGYDDIRND